jgi:hypothetical protein
MIEGKFCCDGPCYDTSKSCRELGGLLIDSYNNCKGSVVGSSETNRKGATNYCCIGEEKGLSCNVKLGDSSDVCDISCNKCYCGDSGKKTKDTTPQQDYLSQFDLLKKTNGWTCLSYIPQGGMNVWVSEDYIRNECTETFDTGPYGPYCRCGNQYCGGVTQNKVWNRCVNGQCQSVSGQGCIYDRDCVDNNSCTHEACINGVCKWTAIGECRNGDSCCPDGCIHENDNDCRRKCQDGTVLNGCSASKPKYCMASLINSSISLVPFCSECGCPQGLTCFSTGVCYDAKLPAHYLLSDLEITAAGFDPNEFTKSFSADSAGDSVALTYIQESQRYTVKLFHTQDNGPIVYDNAVGMYRLFNFTTVANNEYGDRSIRLKAAGAGGIEVRVLEVQKGTHRIGFQYVSTDEEKINNFASIALQKYA